MIKKFKQNISNIFYLMRMDLTIHSKVILIGAAAFMGVLLIVGAVGSPSGEAFDQNFHAIISFPLIITVGLLITSFSFKE